MVFQRNDLHRYQEEAIAFLKGRSGALLIAPVGAGKTTVIHHAFVDLKRDGLARRMLIVAPLRVAQTVHHIEAKKWAETQDLSFALAVGNERVRLAAFKSEADVVVTNYDALRWLERAAAGRVISLDEFDVVVAEESSCLKSATSQRTKIMARIAGWGPAHFRWAVTATPRSTSEMDLWGQVRFCDPFGKIWPGTFVEWRDRFFTPADRNGWAWRLRNGAGDVIKAAIAPIALSLDEAAAKTRPPIVYNTIRVPLPEKARKTYFSVENGLKAELAPDIALPQAAIAIVGKLLQITSGAAYHADGEKFDVLHDAKIEALKEIVEGTTGGVLVLYQFRHEVERMRAEFPNLAVLGGGTSRAEAERIVADWNAGKIEVLAGHPLAMGHGLNLQRGGSTVVWLTTGWSSELFEQANGRLARQGQTGTVTVHQIVAEGTVDLVAARVVRQRLVATMELMKALRGVVPIDPLAA
jgi:superfamily II DNA or RNA helicase